MILERVAVAITLHAVIDAHAHTTGMQILHHGLQVRSIHRGIHQTDQFPAQLCNHVSGHMQFWPGLTGLDQQMLIGHGYPADKMRLRLTE